MYTSLWKTGGGATLNFIQNSLYLSNAVFKLKCLMQIPLGIERKTISLSLFLPLMQNVTIFKPKLVSARLCGNLRVSQGALWKHRGVLPATA